MHVELTQQSRDSFHRHDRDMRGDSWTRAFSFRGLGELAFEHGNLALIAQHYTKKLGFSPLRWECLQLLWPGQKDGTLMKTECDRSVICFVW
jgi:hypothetical protein